MESEELSVFQKHEAAALFRTLTRLRERFLARAQSVYPEHFPVVKFTEQGCLSQHRHRLSTGSTNGNAQSKQAELLAAYQDLGSKLFCFRLGSPGGRRGEVL
jgi:hypothetical protein